MVGGNDIALWKRVKRVFAEVVDLDAEERERRLAQICVEDAALRQEVESLLEAELDTPSVLEQNAPAFAAPALAMLADSPKDEDWRDRHLGPYRLIRQIGAGGMGRVFLAERDDATFEQQVAIKVMRLSAAEEGDLRTRFHAERQILANLEHPSIAKVFDGGVTEDGLPFLVMEYVPGASIVDHCNRLQLGVRKRLVLFAQACEAVQHAHRHLVVHRDLKPSNILVTEDGRVKLLDFGIAKLLDSSQIGLDDAPLMTRTGLMVLTPEYAAPEQIRRREITTATDVYALGVVLFEMLTGSRPYELVGASPIEIERAICLTEPPRPSTHLSRRSASSRANPITPARLRGDLDTIVLKALRKEPVDRYQSVQALADDIDRLLSGLPIRARPSTWRYRTKKFVKRNRYGVVAAGLVLLTLLGGLMATVVQRNRAEREALKARHVTDFLLGMFEANAPGETLGMEITAREILERGTERASLLSGEPQVQAELLNVIGRIYALLGNFERAEPLLEKAISAQRLGRADSLALAQSLYDLGVLLFERGALKEAESLHHEALTLRRNELGRSHTDTAASLSQLGLVLSGLEDDSAETTLREALAIRRQKLGDSHPKTAESFCDLGLHLYSLDRWSEAAELFRRTLDILSDKGDEHIVLYTDTINNLALTLQEQGHLAEAESLHRQSIVLLTRVFGADHPRIVTDRNNLGGALWRQGFYEEAEAMFRGVLEARLAQAPTGVPTSQTMYVLARVLIDRGRYEEAESLARQALALREQSLGPRNTTVAGVRNTLGVAVESSGRLDEAESLYREILEILTADGELQDRNFFRAQANLGSVLGKRGRPEEAASLLREALDGRRLHFGNDHPEVADTLDKLGWVAAQSGDHETAITTLHESLTLRLARHGANHPKTAKTRSLLGLALIQAGDLGAAESELLESVQIQIELLGSEHPETSTTQLGLVDLYERLGRTAEADRTLGGLG